MPIALDVDGAVNAFLIPLSTMLAISQFKSEASAGQHDVHSTEWSWLSETFHFS